MNPVFLQSFGNLNTPRAMPLVNSSPLRTVETQDSPPNQYVSNNICGLWWKSKSEKVASAAILKLLSHHLGLTFRTYFSQNKQILESIRGFNLLLVVQWGAPWLLRSPLLLRYVMISEIHWRESRLTMNSPNIREVSSWLDLDLSRWICAIGFPDFSIK